VLIFGWLVVLVADIKANEGGSSCDLEIDIDLVQKSDRNAIFNYVDSGCDLDKFGRNWSFLHWAAYYNWPDLAIKLLARGVKTDLRTSEGTTALQLATFYGNKKIVSLLLSNGADADLRSIKGNELPLETAMKNGDKVMARILWPHTKRSCEIFDQDQKKRLCSFLFAVFWGDISKTKELIADGIDLDVQGANGMTALHWAIKGNNKKIVSLLLENGANANRREKKEGLTPIFLTPNFLETSPDRLHVANLLIESGADINHKDNAGETVIIHALFLKRLELSYFLVSKGAELNFFSSKKRYNPLHLAVSWVKDTKLVGHMIKKGADINFHDEHRDTPLHMAVRYENEEMVKLLLKEGADVNLKNKSNERAIDIARKRKKAVIENLIKQHHKAKNIKKVDTTH
jgi:ankyrin repeat protein